jgi:hypothetical protein
MGSPDNNNDRCNKLPTIMQKEITTFLHRSLPLCVILTDEKLYSWYCEHFINIFARVVDGHRLVLDFLEHHEAHQAIVWDIILRFDLFAEPIDVISFIRNKIDLGYYVIANIDEYYLSEKSAYNKQHFIHPSLIYGYDNKTKQLMAIGFNAVHSMERLVFEYDPFVVAFEKAREFYTQQPDDHVRAFQLIKLKPHYTSYSFDMGKFLNKIRDYLHSNGDNSIVYALTAHEKRKEPIAYGMGVYDVIIDSLRNPDNYQFSMDYFNIHMLYEHKKAIYTRLQYIKSNYNVKEEFDPLLEEYGEIVKEFNKNRLVKLKYSYMPDEHEMIPSMVHSLSHLKSLEFTILTQIYTQLLKLHQSEFPKL